MTAQSRITIQSARPVGISPSVDRVALRTEQDHAVADPGQTMYELVQRLFPICRSITGPGVRQTLAEIARQIPLEVHEVPTGTQVFDWIVPPEWHIQDAYIKDSSGRRVVDFRQSNLHVVNFSVPVHRRMTLDQLRPHLFSLPERPDWIPYRTTYYERTWGFCLTHRQLVALCDEEYEVCIDAQHLDGSLTYGECYLPGETSDEMLLSCHICHPSLANDNLASLAVAVEVVKHLLQRQLRYSYRLLLAPGTIGAITWLATHREQLPYIRHGLVLALLGDSGCLTYKRSRRGAAEIDRAAAHVLSEAGDHRMLEFEPFGYDERQYCSPGFDLPMGCLMRSPWGQFAEYHTSADNLELVRPECLADSLAKCLSVVDLLEGNRRYLNLCPLGEPQLGRRGLYDRLDGPERQSVHRAMLWTLNLSDGRHTLLDIAERSQLPFAVVRRAADLLLAHQLLKEDSSSPAEQDTTNAKRQI